MTDFLIKMYQGANGHQVAYHYLTTNQANGTVLILPGLMETPLKYNMLSQLLLKKKFNVLALNHRGMGFSQRFLADSMKVHLDSFDYYVKDVMGLLSELEVNSAHSLYIVAHSTGGLIATHLMAKDGYNFRGTVLSAPLFGVNAKGLPTFMIRLLAQTLNVLGLGEQYVFGYSKNSYKNRSMTSTRYTHDPEMFEIDSKIYRDNPEARSNGPTFKWLCEIQKGCDKLIEMIPRINCPVTILQAENDYYVNNRLHNEYSKYFKNLRIIIMPGAYHEILMENPQIRETAFNHIFKMLETHD